MNALFSSEFIDILWLFAMTGSIKVVKMVGPTLDWIGLGERNIKHEIANQDRRSYNTENENKKHFL